MQICAILAVRNEQRYLGRCLRHLIDQGLVVAVIDNDSTDETGAILDRYPSEKLVHREVYPYRGYFDLEGLLAIKQRIAASYGADWFMHVDADEIPEAPLPFRNLRQGIEAADTLGYNVINFDEFLFVPQNLDAPSADHDYVAQMTYYYHFAPEKHRLQRLWKMTASIDIASCAGHRVTVANARIYPRNFVLRHYIALGQRDLYEKYRTRVFSPEALARGWHANRHGVGTRPIRFPDATELHEYKDDGRWDTSRPWRKHFFDPRID